MVDPDQVRVYIEALHPRGVREKELSRMLTRFLEFAKESCTKVKNNQVQSSSLFLFYNHLSTRAI